MEVSLLDRPGARALPRGFSLKKTLSFFLKKQWKSRYWTVQHEHFLEGFFEFFVQIDLKENGEIKYKGLPPAPPISCENHIFFPPPFFKQNK